MNVTSVRSFGGSTLTKKPPLWRGSNLLRRGEREMSGVFQHLPTTAVAVRPVRLSVCVPRLGLGRPVCPDNVNAAAVPGQARVWAVSRGKAETPTDTTREELRAALLRPRKSLLALSRQPGSNTVHISVVPVSLPPDVINNYDWPG